MLAAQEAGGEGSSPTPSVPPGYRYYGKLVFDVDDVAPTVSPQGINQLDDILLKAERGEQVDGEDIGLANLLIYSGQAAELRKKSLVDPVTRMAISGLFFAGATPAGSALTTSEILDATQTGLDILGMSPDPVLGRIANGVNALVYAGRGEGKQAALSVLAIIPFEKLLAKDGKLLGFIPKVEGAKPVAVTIEKTGGALVPAGSKRLGEWGEARLKALLNGAGEKKWFSTSWGRREIDRLVNGIAHESKAGVNVKLTQPIVNQIMKDEELINKGIIRGAHWHFWQGADPDLLQFLNLHGIQYTLH